MGLVLKLLPFVRFIGIFAGVLGLYISVRNTGVISEQNKQAQIEIEGVKVHDEVEKRIRNLSADELNKRLQRWTRDKLPLG